MASVTLINILFPHFAQLHVDRIVSAGRSVRVHARSRERAAACPGCGTVSARVHSRYERRILDRPVGDRELVLHLRVRRFFCDTVTCAKKTFAEQIPGLTVRHGRCTVALRRMWELIAVALGGRGGARLAEQQAAGVSRATLLRLVRALPDPEVGPVRVLGVDDVALRRGHDYGTVLVDLETSRPVDLLDDRSAESLAGWLDAHPGVQVVCRDRAAFYAEGASRGAPTAVQVADRWHLWHNLCQAAERAVARLRPQWRTPRSDPPPQAPPPAPAAARPPERGLAHRARARHTEIHALKATGLPLARIAERLRLDRKTVRRYARATTPDELINGVSGARRSSLDGHAAYLRARCAEGVTSTGQLHRELRDRGVRVSERTVRRFLIHLRAHTPVPQRPVDPTRREVTRSITCHPDDLDEADQVTLKELGARCPDLEATRGLVGSFAEMLVHRRGADRLDGWVRQAEASTLPELRGFAAGLRQDWDAVQAGLTLPWNSGPVEGHVNRIKTIKRQMYGRARPDLLRKRVLLGD